MCRRKNPEDTNLQQGLEQAEAKMNVGGYTHAAAPGKAIGEPQPEPEPSALSVGGKVTVQGLKGAPQHNGKHGRVLRFDAVKGRYQVELASEPDAGRGKPVRLLIKAVNLSRVESGQRIEEAATRIRPDSAFASETAPESTDEIAIEDIGCTPGYRENLAAQ